MLTLITPTHAVVTTIESSIDKDVMVSIFDATKFQKALSSVRAGVANSMMDAQSILYISTINKFNNDIEKKKHLVTGYLSEAKSFFNKTLSFISSLEPTNIIVGLTNSKSIYFRFYNSSQFETHLEVFYTQEDEEDDLEAVVTIYKNDETRLKQFGSIEEVFSSIKHTLKEEESSNLITMLKDNFVDEYAIPC